MLELSRAMKPQLQVSERKASIVASRNKCSELHVEQELLESIIGSRNIFRSLECEVVDHFPCHLNRLNSSTPRETCPTTSRLSPRRSASRSVVRFNVPNVLFCETQLKLRLRAPLASHGADTEHSRVGGVPLLHVAAVEATDSRLPQARCLGSFEQRPSLKQQADL